MLKANRIVSAVAVCALLALSAFAQGGTTTKPAAAKSTPAKTVAKPKPAPKTDAGIQACIDQKFAAAPKLKDQHFTVAVVGGVATITGEAANGGSKGSVVGLAKSCGAKKVVNNLTVTKVMKPAATHPTVKPK